MLFVWAFSAFLKFVRSRHGWIGRGREGTFWRIIVLLTQLFLSCYQAATVGDIADGWRVIILMTFELGQQLIGIRHEF